MTTKKKQTEPEIKQETDTTFSTGPEHLRAVSGTTVWSPSGVSSIQSIYGAPQTNNLISQALAAAQAECKNAAHNRFNSHFKSSYADLAAVKECVVPVFLKHGLAIVQGTNVDRDIGFYLETRVRHISGQELVFKFPLPPDTMQIQKVGSVITYARRYTYAMIGGIVAEDDLDGNETLPKSTGRPADDNKGSEGHFL